MKAQKNRNADGLASLFGCRCTPTESFFFLDGSAGVTGINVKQVIGANSREKVMEGWLVGVTSRV